MGNSASLPEKVFTAVQKNDVTGFQALVATFSSAGAGDPATRARVLEWKDKSGRTPLLVAAAKNHYQILQQLIALGANLHYINPARDSVGGALHEAAARRQEAAVELLLAAGANPFAANASGRTALDEAVLSGHTGVVRAIEKYADFAGMVGFKTRAMAGLSHKYKARWAVLMPYIAFRREGSVTGPAAASLTGGAPKPPRRCLWLYKDKSSVSPRCRLWVDGATVQTHGPGGTEATLRLHTSHGEPLGDLATSYNHGYCVTLRPADLTPVAAATYQRLVGLLGQPGTGTPAAAQPQPQPARPATAPPAMPPAAVTLPGPPAPASAASAGNVFYPSVPPASVVAYGAPGSAPYLFPPPPPMAGPAGAVVPPSPSSAPQPYSGAAGPCLMASPLSLYQQQRHAVPAVPAVSPQSVTAASPAAGDRKGGPVPVTGMGGQVIDGVFIESMAALPGESDEAFAARLASAISATSHQSQQDLFPHASASATAAPGSDPSRTDRPGGQSQPQPGPRQRVSGSGTGGGGTNGAGPTGSTSAAGAHPWTEAGGAAATAQLINFQSDPGGGNAAPMDGAAAAAGPSRPTRLPATAAGGGGGALDALDMDAVAALIAGGAANGAGPSGSAGGSTAGPAAAAPPRCSEKEGREEAPSAPPADAFMAPARPPPDLDVECIICMSAPKEVGFLHGDSVHRCVCRACSERVPVGSPCPLCRRPVERVLGVF